MSELEQLKAENEALKAEANKMVCVYCGFKADKNAKVMVDHIIEHCEKRPDSMVNMKKVLEDFKHLEEQLLIYAEALNKTFWSYDVCGDMLCGLCNKRFELEKHDKDCIMSTPLSEQLFKRREDNPDR